VSGKFQRWSTKDSFSWIRRGSSEGSSSVFLFQQWSYCMKLNYIIFKGVVAQRLECLLRMWDVVGSTPAYSKMIFFSKNDLKMFIFFSDLMSNNRLDKIYWPFSCLLKIFMIIRVVSNNFYLRQKKSSVKNKNCFKKTTILT
jgi:hypothetical protein